MNSHPPIFAISIAFILGSSIFTFSFHPFEWHWPKIDRLDIADIAGIILHCGPIQFGVQK
jgi:hypothetical protein